MKVKELLEMVAKYPQDQQVDVEVGGVLVPIIGSDASGECKTGVKLILGRDCQLAEEVEEEE
jgi:hypothetical protein